MKNSSLCYQTVGLPENPCIMLIMGVAGQLIHWPLELTEGLANKGFYVVTFDNRDAGLSKHYDHLRTPSLLEVLASKKIGMHFTPPYTLDDMAADVIQLMDELHIKKAHIAGISMGGIIGQLIALNYPDRAKSLILIASTSGDPHLPPSKPEVLAYFSSQKRQAEDMESFVTSKLALHQVYNHPDHFEEKRMRDIFGKTWKRGHDPAGFQRTLLAMIAAKPRTEQLKKLHINTLVIHGDFDPVFPLEHGKQLAACIPNARLEIIEKMGHGLPTILCPKLVDIIADFLKEMG